MICPFLGSSFPKIEVAMEAVRQTRLAAEIQLSRQRGRFILRAVPSAFG
jgi:hypothetical protein